MLSNREAEEAEQQRLLEEELAKEKEAKKEGMRKRKPAFKATEKTDEELKGYSKLNMDLTKGSGVKAVDTKVHAQSIGLVLYWIENSFVILNFFSFLIKHCDSAELLT